MSSAGRAGKDRQDGQFLRRGRRDAPRPENQHGRRSGLGVGYIDLDLDALLRATVAAELLSVSVRTLEDWRRLGAGPVFVRVGARAVRYRARDLMRWADARVRTSTADMITQPTTTGDRKAVGGNSAEGGKHNG